jgi:hypothetical protein
VRQANLISLTISLLRDGSGAIESKIAEKNQSLEAVVKPLAQNFIPG